MSSRLTVAALTAVVVAGGLLANHAERAWPATRPFVTQGAPGDTVPLEPGTVTVHGARAARTLDDGYGGELTTAGVWVAVDLSVSGTEKPLRVGRFSLVDDDGRAFDATRRLSPNHPGAAQPGSPIRTEIVFEIPEDALGGLALRASELSVPQLSAVAEVPVPVGPVDDTPLAPRAATLEEPAEGDLR
ncbi:hypothetical protein [Georgenia soli]|uniref:hypothetical protein n=1 Tax=Georgenia soli TaxID=638953 RepID=UPI000BF5F710|nr:hypothetical protein [Georgenia soli]